MNAITNSYLQLPIDQLGTDLEPLRMRSLMQLIIVFPSNQLFPD